jgi:RHS repeat-associated protein
VLAGSTADGTARLENINQLFVRKDGALLLATQGRVLQLASDYLYSVATLAASTETATVAAPWVVTDVSGNYYYILREWYAGAFADSVRKFTTTLPKDASSDTIIIPTNGELYIFDKKGRHLRTLNALTQIVKYEFGYTGGGLLSTITDGDGNVTRIERAAGGVPVAIVGPYGQRTALGIDNNGWLASVTAPGNRTYAMQYHAGGLLEKFIHPNGYYGYMEYDTLGRLVKDGNSEGGWKELLVEKTGNDRKITVRTETGKTRTMSTISGEGNSSMRESVAYDGTVTKVKYNSDGSTITIDPDGTETTVTMAPDIRFGMLESYAARTVVKLPNGTVSTTTRTQSAEFLNPSDPLSLLRLTTVTTDNGRTTTTIYDAATRTSTVISPLGRKLIQTIDARGRVVSEQIPGLENVYYEYDDYGRLKSVSQGSGENRHVFIYNYDDNGMLKSTTDPLGRTNERYYDSSGALVRRILPGERDLAFRYDELGRMVGITPPTRPEHRFVYTLSGLLTEYAPPELADSDSATAYQYNADGEVVGMMRPDGKNIVYNYDSITGKVKSVDTPEGRYEMQYNAVGNPVGHTAPDGMSLTYIFDGPVPVGEIWQGDISGRIDRTLDADINVRSQKVNNQSEIVFDYDNDGQVIRAGDLTLTYDAQNGLPTGSTLDTVTENREYNVFGELSKYETAVASSSVFSASYDRDRGGRIVDKTETVEGVTSRYHYVYDEAGRLADVSRNGITTAHYEYDDNGNRTLARYSETTVTGTYDDQDRMLTYGGNSYAYTANGELLAATASAGVTTYTYDVMGNLRSLTLPDGKRIDYLIQIGNRRVGKKVDGVLEQAFIYDGGQIVAELDREGKIKSRFVYSGDANVPDYMIRDGRKYRIVTDHLGSPRLIVDAASGVIAQRMDFDEFGIVLIDTNPGFQPFGFAGGLDDPDTGLIRFGERDYDPYAGRWTAKDPIRFNGGNSNLYGYVANDPVNNTDPSGLKSKGACVTGSLGLVIGRGMMTYTTTCTYRDDCGKLAQKVYETTIYAGGINEGWSYGGSLEISEPTPGWICNIDISFVFAISLNYGSGGFGGAPGLASPGFAAGCGGTVLIYDNGTKPPCKSEKCSDSPSPLPPGVVTTWPNNTGIPF